jgi:hypothetical protein
LAGERRSHVQRNLLLALTSISGRSNQLAGSTKVGERFDTKHQYGGMRADPGHEHEPCPITTDIVLARAIILPRP